MTELKDNIFAIEMPEDAESCEIRGEHSKRPYQLLSFFGEGDAIDLPIGSWQFLFTTKEMSEKQARRIVKCNQDFVPGAKVQMAFYENYEGQYSSFPSAIASFESLLRSKGLDESKNYAIIQKQNDNATTK